MCRHFSALSFLSLKISICLYRVLGQVSCEVAQPKPNRPTEGQLFVNVELSPMASPAFESGRLVYVNISMKTGLLVTLQ